MDRSPILGFNPKTEGYHRSCYTTRSVPILENAVKNKLSQSAMSSRSYSRMNGHSNNVYQTSENPKMSLTFSSDDDFEKSNLTEEQYEEQLLTRLVQQQEQLHELQNRQKKLLELQKNLAKLDQNAETSVSEKLNKLQSARNRIDQLQELVDTIKNSGKSSNFTETPDQESIALALGQLNELKNLVDTLSQQPQNTPSKLLSSPSSNSSLKPVFSHHVNDNEGKYTDLSEVPVVTVVRHERDNKRRNKLDDANSKDLSTKSGATKNNLSQDQLSLNDASTEELWNEMQRHQVLLRQLKERREELEKVMKETNDLKADPNLISVNSAKSERSNVEISVNDPCDFETSDSGRLFGLNESATKRLIDIIRAQKNLDGAGMTEKTTATWGSSDSKSSSSSDLEESDDDNDGSCKLYDSSMYNKNDNETQDFSKPAGFNNESLSLAQETGTDFKDQRTKDFNKFEIDFRPPTRRQINTKDKTFVFESVEDWNDSVIDIQKSLSSADITMQLLLEDQQALLRLLQNTMNIQNSGYTNNACYGISPDFLLYQLDNCYSQIISLQKEMRSMQWRLYKVLSNPPTKRQYDMAFRPTITQRFLPSNLSNTYGVAASPSKQHSKELINRAMPSNTNTIPPQFPLSNEFILQSAMYDKYARSSAQNETTPPKSKSLRHKILRKKIKKEPSYDNKDKTVSSISKYNMEAKNLKSKMKHRYKYNKPNNDLFESLRDNIYSEAAILISQNESRPHFLMELFHCLQQMNTDLLRQQCLYNVQDVLNAYISKSPKAQSNKSTVPASNNGQNVSYSENTPSESAVTSDDEIYAKLRAKVSKETSYDYSLKISSGSELTSPSSEEETPFASEDLGNTVIHLDAALRHMREVERIKQEVTGSGSASKSSSGESKEYFVNHESQSTIKQSVPNVDPKQLNNTIKKVISNIIPFLKDERENNVNIEFLATLQSTVIDSILTETKKCNDADGRPKNTSLDAFFTKQLQTILSENMLKFVAQRVGSCGEDLVLSMSEVLFNELAFYYMMQDMDKEEKEESTKQEDKEKNTVVEPLQNDETAKCNHNANDKESIESEDISSQIDKQSDVSPNYNDIEDSKDKKENESNSVAVTFDLSVSETKPLTSYGSGEDEDDDSDDYPYNEADVPTSIQHEQAITKSSDKVNFNDVPIPVECGDTNNKDTNMDKQIGNVEFEDLEKSNTM